MAATTDDTKTTTMTSTPVTKPKPVDIRTIVGSWAHHADDMQFPPVQIEGWIRTVRPQGELTFIKVYDTSSHADLQIIAKQGIVPEGLVTHGSIRVTGRIVKSPKALQLVELQATEIEIIGDTREHDPATYPLAKTKLTLAHLRQYPHLRIRTRTFQSTMRISSALSFATHDFFRRRHLHQVFTPLMTGSDCEGGGEVFHVETDYKDPFFTSGKKFLTVSGQLELEEYACGGIGSAYTFGPCFRAEKSSTSRHLAEFWMVEAELIKISLTELIDFAESYVQHCIMEVLKTCHEDLKILEEFTSPGITDRLKAIVSQPFKRIPYREAIKLVDADFGTDLSSDQEKQIMAKLSKDPVPTFVVGYPQSIKAFYMKPLEDGTVQSFDLLVPGIGELIGGSVREDDLKKLTDVMTARGMKHSDFKEYLDIRRFGSIRHGGFGLGFGRLVMLCTGMESIRDVTPFPVFYKC